MVEKLKEKVQLLAGFDGDIQPQAMQRGEQCLARFAQRLRGIPREHIVMMGTYALRQAGNRQHFADRAERLLGVPLQVISGAQEAQLIYRAVAHQQHLLTPGRLVIDIGGGSTELALGDAADAADRWSLELGCVAFKDRFFQQPGAQAENYRAAKAHAVDVLRAAFDRSTQRRFDPQQMVVGTSGTIDSIATVLEANGWTSGAITADALHELEQAITSGRWLLDVDIPGLLPDRVDIFPGGLAILSACFDVLALSRLHYVDVSLLHGMICDRYVPNSDAATRCDDSVEQLAKQFTVDTDQARRVCACVMGLYQQVSDWAAPDMPGAQNWLKWAAQLHEIGMHIGARHYHRHGAYIIKHANLPGFTSRQQEIVALLVRGHRRSFPGLAFRAFDEQLAQVMLRLVVLLRVGVILQRSHHDAGVPVAQLQVDGNRLQLSCGAGWLQNNPLSARELTLERQQLKAAGLELQVSD